jgi:hypothetical protein
MRIISTTIAVPTRRQRNTGAGGPASWVQPTETSGGAIDSATPGKYTTFFVANIGEGHVEGLTAQGMGQRGPVPALPPTQAALYDVDFAFGFMVNSFADIGGLFGVQILP